MNVSDIISLLNRLKAAGIKLSLEGDNLGVAFDDNCDEELISEIRIHKASLVHFLKNVSVEKEDLPVEKAEESAYYPLAATQKSIWLHQKIEPESRAYYIYTDILIDGPLDIAVLKESLHIAVRKHEVLRTVFKLENGDPVLFTLSPDSIDLPFQVITIAEGYSSTQLEKLSLYRDRVSFNLEKGPLFRMDLYAFSQQQYVLSFCIHHIIADAQSLAVLINELIQVYGLLLREGKVEVIPADIQFKDFSSWQEKRHNHPSFQRERTYWKDQFADEPTPVVLPYKNERKNYKTYNGRSLDIRIEKEIIEPVREYYRDKQITPFIFFYSAIQAILFRYTDQNDITIGTSVHGRDNPLFVNQVGLYARILPLRMRFDQNICFDELVELAKTIVQNGLSHQGYPYDLLVKESNLSRDPSRSPLFDIMIDYFSSSPRPVAEHLTFTPVKFERVTSKFDLTFTFLDEKDAVSLHIEYNTDLFSDAFILQISRHFKSLMLQLIKQPAVPVNKLSFLGEEEIKFLLYGRGMGRELPLPFTPVGVLFEETAARFPESAAIECDGVFMSYGQLNREVNRLAHYLKTNLTEPAGKVVGIMLERSERLIIAVLAIIKAGAAFLPVDPDAPPSYRKHILSDSKADLLITDSLWLPDMMEIYEGELFAMDVQQGILQTPDTNPVNNISPSSLSYILYTSGSTGMPKGVEITQRNIGNYLRWAAGYYYEGLEKTRVPWFTSFSFDLSLTSIFTPLLRGDLLELYPQSNPAEAFLQMLKSEHEFGMIKLTPSHINVLGLLDTDSLKVRRVIAGGEELTRTHIHILQKSNPYVKVFNEYGPTETTVGCTVEEVTADDITIGRPMPNTSIYILNKAGELMPDGCWGEIAVGGAGVARGYHRLEELTKERFAVNRFTGDAKMYRTGDIGRWLPDGRIAYRGRADSQVKMNGFRIEPGEIEAKLEQIDGIDKSIVLIRQEGTSKKLVAFFAGDKEFDIQEIRAGVSALLPAHMVPAQYVYVETWPLTTNGKTDKAALLALPDDTQGSQVEIVLPQNETQKELLDIFTGLLSVNNLSIHENLFNAGLDSLKAIKAQSVLEKIFPGKVQIHDLFSKATIAKLAEHIYGPVVQEEALPEIIDF